MDTNVKHIVTTLNNGVETSYIFDNYHCAIGYYNAALKGGQSAEYNQKEQYHGNQDR